MVSAGHLSCLVFTCTVHVLLCFCIFLLWLYNICFTLFSSQFPSLSLSLSCSCSCSCSLTYFPLFSYIIFETCYLASFPILSRVSSFFFSFDFITWRVFFDTIYTSIICSLSASISYTSLLLIDESIRKNQFRLPFTHPNSSSWARLHLCWFHLAPISVGRTTPFQWGKQKRKQLSNPNDPPIKVHISASSTFGGTNEPNITKMSRSKACFSKTPTLIGGANEKSIWGVSTDFGSLW